MTWHFGLTDLSGVALGEIQNAYERKLTLELNGLPSASVKLRLDNPLATEITDRKGDVLLKVYQGSTLRFVGDLVSAEEAGADGDTSLVCNFAGPLWRLQHRLAGQSDSGVTYSATARGSIASDLIVTANAAHDTGVRLGTISTLAATSAGPWIYKPIGEAIGELGSARVIPLGMPGTATGTSGWTITDDFGFGGVELHNLTIPTALHPNAHPLDNPSGQFWTASTLGPDADDFTIATLGTDFQAVRQSTSDTASGSYAYVGGRVAFAGSSTFSNVLAKILFRTSVVGTMRTGHLLRYTDDNNFAMAIVDVQSGGVAYAVIFRVIAGLQALVKSAIIGNIPAATDYELWTQIDASGDYAMWVNTVGSDPTAGLRMTGSDANFASTGALPSGRVGYMENYTSAVASDRIYRYYRVGTPTSSLIPQDMNFEFAPSEPTADVGVDGVAGAGLKLASLNVSTGIGTSKPDLVFEFGTGTRNTTSYQRVINRDTICNKAVLPPGGDDTLWRITSSTPDLDTSIATHGLFEEVVSSEANAPDLRQAYVDAVGGVRQDAREVVTFVPSTNAPTFGTDYILGDTVTARAVEKGTVRFNGTMRVYGIELTIDEEGKETVVPKLQIES